MRRLFLAAAFWGLWGLAAMPVSAALLTGAARLQDPLAGSLGLTPVLPACPTVRLAVGVSGQGSLRSDRLSFDLWNRYAGRHLEEADKRALLAELGATLDLRQHVELSLLEGQWALPEGRRLGLRLEHVASGVQVVDARALEALLLGNDPAEPLAVERARLGAEVLQRLRLAWNTPLPAPWAQTLRLPRAEAWTLGLGLFLEQGTWLTRTRSFSALLPPPQGEVSGRLDLVQEVAGPGFGWGLDLGLGVRLPVAGGELALHGALRGLAHHQVWRQARRERVRVELPATPVDASFDADAFSVEVADTSWSEPRSNLRVDRSPGWLLAVDGTRGPWRHTVAWERLPEDARGAGRHQLALAVGRGWGAWRLLGQAALSSGRGPSWGAEAGWCGGLWDVALAGSGYGGLGGASRGGQLGLQCRWRIP